MEGRSPKPQSGNRELVQDFLQEIQFGLSVADIEYLDDNTDIRNRNEIKIQIQKLKEIDILTMKLAIAESTIISGAYLQSKKNKNIYIRWKTKQINRIKQLMGSKIEDGWKIIGGRSKKI